MIRLRLTHGLSHSNGYVSATSRNPFVTVEDEAVARYCVDSGFFEIVDAEIPKQPASESANKPSDPPADTGKADEHADGDELDGMTVNQLKVYAETVGINLGKLNRKADIIEAIRKAEAEE